MPQAKAIPAKRAVRERVKLVDLDQRPELISATLNAFAACPPGKHHLVCGLPARMGQIPQGSDLTACLGVVLALTATELLGAIALCPYSDEQATLWGPASSAGFHGSTVPEQLLAEVKQALRGSGYTSLRALVDLRNRDLRAFLLAHGFAVWKDNIVFERPLRSDLPAIPEVRRITTKDHRAVMGLIRESFPETGHLTADLATRERQGYRHYLLSGPAGVLAAAAVEGVGPRSWLKLIGVSAANRGKGHGHRLLSGLMHLEAERGATQLGLEVLADNVAAVALYGSAGFKKAFTSTIMTAPL
jgi:ribosomal-protein-alanine N-acetyltransferase